MNDNHLKFESLEKQLSKEKYSITLKFKKAYPRIIVLKKLYPRFFRFPFEHKGQNERYIKPSFNLLKEEYDQLTSQLSKKNFGCIQTHAERRFLKKLKQNSKKQIYTAIWIGSHCIDIFIPNLTTDNKSKYKMRGLAVEIDGDCHNIENKMSKDERKGVQLQILGIGITHIYNWDFSNNTIGEFLNNYKNIKTLDSRARVRLWTKIYSFTLAIHLENREFFQIFKRIED